jgi:hypothetical protein
MRQFLVDEIPRRKIGEIEAYLKEKAEPSGLDKVYWLKIPEDLLTPTQKEHDACGPHYLAVELGRDFLKFEFLVRCRERLRCDCIQYATRDQESFLFKFAQDLIAALDLTC